MHLARNSPQLLLAIAPDEVRPIRRTVGNDNGHLPAGVRLDSRLDKTGQQVVESFAVAAVEHRVGCHQGNPRQPREAGQQIEVAGYNPAGWATWSGTVTTISDTGLDAFAASKRSRNPCSSNPENASSRRS